MINDDDEITPPRSHVVTDSERAAHFAEYPPRTPVVTDLVSAPRNAFEIDIDKRIASLEASRRSWRVVSAVGIPALIGAAMALMLWSADKITASSERVGETRAEIKSQGKQIELLQQEVLMLRKLSGLDLRPDASISFR